MNVMILLQQNMFHVESDLPNISMCGKRISTTDKFMLDVTTLRKHGNKVCLVCWKKLKQK